MRLMQMEGIITGFVATGLTCALVILGLGELTANPYSYSGTQTPTPTHTAHR
jgi:hypothetical protein